MAKATIQDITDAGFRPEQFGTPPDWVTADTGYLARLLTRAEAWARGKYGTGYDTVPAASTVHERLRSAELCWVSGHLWKRRAAFIDSNAASARENPAYLNRREYDAAATRAFECADENLSLAIGGEDAVAGTGAALVYAETGPYATTSLESTL